MFGHLVRNPAWKMIWPIENVHSPNRQWCSTRGNILASRYLEVPPGRIFAVSTWPPSRLFCLVPRLVLNETASALTLLTIDLASSSPFILMCASKHKLRVWQLLPTAVSNCPMFYFLIIYVFCRQPVPAFNSTDYQHIVEPLIDKYIEYISAAGKTFHNFPVITFRVRHSRGEIYIGHGRLCVCMSVCPSHHSHTRLTITRTQV